MKEFAPKENVIVVLVKQLDLDCAYRIATEVALNFGFNLEPLICKNGQKYDLVIDLHEDHVDNFRDRMKDFVREYINKNT